MTTRADWLALAAERLIPLINRRRWPAEIRIISGPMRVVAPSSVGEAWIEDDIGHITVSDTIDDPFEALEVLLHELVHLTVGPRHSHSYRFRRVYHRLGFIGRATEARAGLDLACTLACLLLVLPDYPALEAIPA